MHVWHACQVTIYRHPQLAPHVQQYQHNVRNAVLLQRALPVIVAITSRRQLHVSFALISQTAIPVTKLQMHDWHACQVTICRHPQLVRHVQQFQHNVPAVLVLQRALPVIVAIISRRQLHALLALISQTAIPVAKAQMHVWHACQVTIYRHPQLVPHVQQYQHNVRNVVVLQLVLPAIVAII
jgi:hypothetical protein